MVQQCSAQAASAVIGIDAKIEKMRFLATDGHDPVSLNYICLLEDSAVVTKSQTLPERLLRPGIGKALRFNSDDIRQVLFLHGTYPRMCCFYG